MVKTLLEEMLRKAYTANGEHASRQRRCVSGTSYDMKDE